MKHNQWVILKIIGTVIIFSVITYLTDIPHIIKTIKNIPPSTIILALLLQFFALFIYSIRWWLLFRALLTNTLHYTSVWQYYFIGVFFNNIIPSSMGGDVIRILYLKKKKFNFDILISSTFVDRLIGLLTIILFGTFSAYFAGYQEGLYLLIMLSIIFLFGILLVRYKKPLLRTLLASLYHIKKLSFFTHILRKILLYRNKKESLMYAIFLSIFGQCIILFIYYLLGFALGIIVPWYVYFIALPIQYIAASLPLSIGGHGVREGVMITIMLLYGVDEQLAIALSLSYFCIYILCSLPGGLLILKKH